MDSAYNNFEQIYDYLHGQMSQQQTEGFKKRLLVDTGLQEELQLHLNIHHSIVTQKRVIRSDMLIAQLRQQVENIKLPFPDGFWEEEKEKTKSSRKLTQPQQVSIFPSFIYFKGIFIFTDPTQQNMIINTSFYKTEHGHREGSSVRGNINLKAGDVFYYNVVNPTQESKYFALVEISENTTKACFLYPYHRIINGSNDINPQHYYLKPNDGMELPIQAERGSFEIEYLVSDSPFDFRPVPTDIKTGKIDIAEYETWKQQNQHRIVAVSNPYKYEVM